MYKTQCNLYHSVNIHCSETNLLRTCLASIFPPFFSFFGFTCTWMHCITSWHSQSCLNEAGGIEAIERRKKMYHEWPVWSMNISDPFLACFCYCSKEVCIALSGLICAHMRNLHGTWKVSDPKTSIAATSQCWVGSSEPNGPPGLRQLPTAFCPHFIIRFLWNWRGDLCYAVPSSHALRELWRKILKEV